VAHVWKLFNRLPRVEHFLRPVSGGKKFTQIHTKHLTVTIDAFTIHNSLWLGKKVPFRTNACHRLQCFRSSMISVWIQTFLLSLYFRFHFLKSWKRNKFIFSSLPMYRIVFKHSLGRYKNIFEKLVISNSIDTKILSVCFLWILVDPNSKHCLRQMYWLRHLL
jgi:hypothetical protein